MSIVTRGLFSLLLFTTPVQAQTKSAPLTPTSLTAFLPRPAAPPARRRDDGARSILTSPRHLVIV